MDSVTVICGSNLDFENTVSFLSRQSILPYRLEYGGNQRERAGNNRVHMHT